MATIEFVKALITLWNERVENFNRSPVSDVTFKPEKRSLDGFHEFMRGQTTILVEGREFYQYGDVLRYLHGSPVVD